MFRLAVTFIGVGFIAALFAPPCWADGEGAEPATRPAAAIGATAAETRPRAGVAPAAPVAATHPGPPLAPDAATRPTSGPSLVPAPLAATEPAASAATLPAPTTEPMPAAPVSPPFSVGPDLRADDSDRPDADVAEPEARLRPATVSRPELAAAGRWPATLAYAILGLFALAAIVGPIVRAAAPREVPPAQSHDEPPGASHHHGPSGRRM